LNKRRCLKTNSAKRNQENDDEVILRKENGRVGEQTISCASKQSSVCRAARRARPILYKFSRVNTK
jgi:hypothetical protein